MTELLPPRSYSLDHVKAPAECPRSKSLPNLNIIVQKKCKQKILRKTWDRVKTIMKHKPKDPEKERIQRNYAILQKRLSEELRLRVHSYAINHKEQSSEFKKKYLEWELFKAGKNRELGPTLECRRKLHEWEHIKSFQNYYKQFNNVQAIDAEINNLVAQKQKLESVINILVFKKNKMVSLDKADSEEEVSCYAAGSTSTINTTSSDEKDVKDATSQTDVVVANRIFIDDYTPTDNVFVPTKRTLFTPVHRLANDFVLIQKTTDPVYKIQPKTQLNKVFPKKIPVYCSPIGARKNYGGGTNVGPRKYTIGGGFPPANATQITRSSSFGIAAGGSNQQVMAPNVVTKSKSTGSIRFKFKHAFKHAFNESTVVKKLNTFIK